MPSLRWCGQSFTFSVPTCATTNTAHPSSLMTRTKWLPVFCSLLGRYRFPFLSFRMSTYFQINCCCPHRQQRVTMNHQTGCSFLSLRFCNFFLLIFFSCKTKDHLSFLMGFSRLLIKLMGYWKRQLAIIHYFSEKEIITTGGIETQSSAAR